jgi:tetratricopeptide (TPR) repeat protein
MRGYWHHLRFAEDNNAAAQRLLRKAIDLDPRQANYHALLAVTHVMRAFYGWSESRDASFRVALESAERALALDDQNTQALRSIGLVHFFSKNHALALSYYERAVAVNPNEAENRALLGAALGVAGDYDAARDQFETAMRLSPRDAHIATWYNYLGIAAFLAGRDEEAAEWARKTVEANPQFSGGYRTLAASYGNLGRLTEAEAARARLQELLPHLTIAQLRESLPYFKNPDDLERYLDGLRKAGLAE